MAQPDIAVGPLTPVLTTMGAGMFLPLTTIVQNVGDGPAQYTGLSFWISPHPVWEPDAVRVSYGSSSLLAPGDTAALLGYTVKIPDALTTGQYYLLFVAWAFDISGSVVESNLDNNSVSVPIIIDGSIPVEPQSTLPVAIGGAATISHGFLWSDDPDNTPGQLTYTIIDQPEHGTILDNGVSATSFTQADIDNGLVRYVENGVPVKSDSFTFQVADPAGNHTETETFNIAVLDRPGPVVTGGGKMSVPVNGAAPLLNPALDTVSLGNTPDQIGYTLLLPPEHGLILDNGAPATGFTQADIDSHRVQYVASGDGAMSDAFVFQATDAAGNHTAPQPFAIQIQGSSDLVLSGDGSTGIAGQANQKFTFDDVSTLADGGADAPAPAADMIDPAGSLALSTDTSSYDAMIGWTLSYSSSGGSQG